ncbi:hypothetical protein DYB37_011625 [Aphanomyces astaci]|uniref:DUF6818 domain-containing protein n=1 Tax=Aphanomyces astaci TaxID=112090 RepID=A0A3L6VGA9_APHAT|nr:hypothetical protein DYB35_008991 [Aphanomyces astaci]RHZ29878.1 hypothetical protein DYB37_011625 [Aphanomyces astaci]RLO07723.1 hypothetical protein DYB28_008142 [Aphanomyces astaci]
MTAYFVYPHGEEGRSRQVVMSIDLLLDTTLDVLPLGKNGWEKVEIHFNRLAQTKLLPVRDVDAFKRKFILLKNHVKPTGDPECPVEVKRAKRIQREIDQSVSVMSLDGDTDPPVPAQEDDEGVGRTGLQQTELQSLSVTLKRQYDQGDPTAGLLSYTAKKRRSIDKYIDGAAEADTKASSDMMTMILLMDERLAKREECRIERQEKYDREREERDARREELHLLLMEKMGQNQK